MPPSFKGTSKNLTGFLVGCTLTVKTLQIVPKVSNHRRTFLNVFKKEAPPLRIKIEFELNCLELNGFQHFEELQSYMVKMKT